MIHAVIAELNPLHKGHEKLIKLAKERASGVIVILSSAFTQRGSPGIISKFGRSRMAIEAGADLVIELPFMFSCNAAPEFARGSVNILGLSGLDITLAFGMEDPDFDIDSLVRIHDSPEYKTFLKSELDRGASFSKANSLALEKILPGSCDFVSKPNNLLALSYIMNIRKNNYDMKTLAVKREGNYQSKVIRGDIVNHHDMMPEYSQRILRESKHADESKLWSLLQNIFIRSTPEDLRKIYCIDEGIENLFIKNWRHSNSLDEFISSCVCARYTRAHIRRRLVYILLGLSRCETAGFMKTGVPYARVLAFNSPGREILRECRTKSQVRFITGLNQARDNFFAQTEYKASYLWELTTGNPNMTCESNKVLQFP